MRSPFAPCLIALAVVLKEALEIGTGSAVDLGSQIDAFAQSGR